MNFHMLIRYGNEWYIMLRGKKNMNSPKKEKTPKIYESPDKGKTVYARDFGAPISTRKLIMKDGVKIDER
jgi:hypothetical protein